MWSLVWSHIVIVLVKGQTYEWFEKWLSCSVCVSDCFIDIGLEGQTWIDSLILFYSRLHFGCSLTPLITFPIQPIPEEFSRACFVQTTLTHTEELASELMLRADESYQTITLFSHGGGWRAVMAEATKSHSLQTMRAFSGWNFRQYVICPSCLVLCENTDMSVC